MYTAHSILKVFTKKIKINQKSDILEHISFNEGRGYIFMYTLDGINILHPKKKLIIHGIGKKMILKIFHTKK